MFAKLSVLALFLVHASAWVIDVKQEENYPGHQETLTFLSTGNDPECVELKLKNVDNGWEAVIDEELSVWADQPFDVTIPEGAAAGTYQFVAYDKTNWDAYYSNEFWLKTSW